MFYSPVFKVFFGGVYTWEVKEIAVLLMNNFNIEKKSETFSCCSII